MSLVYLGGPINGCNDSEVHDWREEAKVLLAERGHSWLDPSDHDFRGRERVPSVTACIVEEDKAAIAESGILLMNCPRPSWGTAMEILYGWELNKSVIAMVPIGAPVSPWLLYHAKVMVASLAEVIGGLS